MVSFWCFKICQKRRFYIAVLPAHCYLLPHTNQRKFSKLKNIRFQSQFSSISKVFCSILFKVISVNDFELLWEGDVMTVVDRFLTIFQDFKILSFQAYPCPWQFLVWRVHKTIFGGVHCKVCTLINDNQIKRKPSFPSWVQTSILGKQIQLKIIYR